MCCILNKNILNADLYSTCYGNELTLDRLIEWTEKLKQNLLQHSSLYRTLSSTLYSLVTEKSIVKETTNLSYNPHCMNPGGQSIYNNDPR
jgi:hypothetical protein